MYSNIKNSFFSHPLRTTLSLKVSDILVIFIIFLFSSGIIFNISGGTTISIFFLFCSTFFLKKNFDRKFIFLAFFFTLFLIFKSLDLQNYTPLTTFYSIHTEIYNYFLIIIILYILSNKFLIIKIKPYIKLFYLIYSISLVYTILIMLNYPFGEFYREKINVNYILSFPNSYIYFSILFSSSTLFQMVFNRKFNVVNVLFFLLNVIFVVFSNYFLQTSIMLFIFSFVLLSNKYFGFGLPLTKIFLLIIIAITFKDFFIYLLEIFINLIRDNDALVLRLNDIILLLKGETGNSINLFIRLELSNESIQTFLSNFLFGVNFNKYNVTSINVGNHNEWFDHLARLGIFGSILFFWLIATFIKNSLIKNIHSIMQMNFLMIILFSFLVYGFLNPFLSFQFIIQISFIILFFSNNKFQLFTL